MKLPELPTDNLYKFMSIVGLLMLFSVYYLFWVKYSELLPLVTDLEVEANVLNVDLKYLSIEAMSLKDEVKKLDYDVEGYRMKQEEGTFLEKDIFIEFQEKSTELEKGYLRLQNLALEQEKKEIKHKGNAKKLSQKLFELRLINSALYVVSSVGIFISVTGFKLWYERWQKHIDRRIAKGK